MAFTAGQKISAADLNNITPFSKAAAATGVTYTTTTTPTDLAGASVTFNAPVASTQVLVAIELDIEASGSADIFIGTLLVDGVLQAGELHHSGPRDSIARTWLVNGLSAGSHTAKVRVYKSGTANTVNINLSGHSQIVVTGNGIS